MTREEILALPVGRELDALVALRVYGLEEITVVGKHYFIDPLDTPLPLYSTDISAAWEVVEKVQERYNFFLAYNHKTKDFQVFIDVPNEDEDATIIHYEYDAPTAPEAICKAALLAVMDT